MVHLHATPRNRSPAHAPGCFPAASDPTSEPAWKQGATPKGRLKYLSLLRKTGAGEAIRTPDPQPWQLRGLARSKP
jgi:hypothetical protein